MTNSTETRGLEAEPSLEHGSPQPFGASVTSRGVNFAVFSAHAERIEVCLFDGDSGRETGRHVLAGRTGAGAVLEIEVCLTL